MVKKLLFIIFIFFTTLGFSQKSLEKLSAAPNPFSNSTKITFSSDKEQIVYFSVRNVLGKRVYHNKIVVKKGKNSFPFSKNRLQSGVYIYTLQNSKEKISKRLVIR